MQQVTKKQQQQKTMSKTQKKAPSTTKQKVKRTVAQQNAFNKPKGGPQRGKRAPAQQPSQRLGELLPKLNGGHGSAPVGDDRPKGVSDLVEPLSVDTMEVTAQINQRSVYMTSYGIVLQAIRKGASYPDINLYQAYQYLARMFLAAFKGEELKGVSLPWFIWELLAAYGPKKAPFKTGYANYSCELQPGSNGTYANQFDVVYNIINSRNYYFNLGAIQNGDIGGFSPLETGVAPAYDEVVGAQSVGRIWSKLGVKKLWTLQEYRPMMGFDTSAYASVVNEYGQCFDSCGGVRTAASHEIFINSPILAHYNLEANITDVGANDKLRGFQEYRPGGMGPLYVGGRILEFDVPERFKNKPPPVPKFYEFYDFFERTALWCCRLQEQAIAAQRTTTQFPLTAQDLALLLRWVALQEFDNELGMDIIQSLGDDQERPLIPLSMGQTSTFRQPLLPKIPSFLNESLRAIRRRVFRARGGDVDFVPILATIDGNYQQYEYEFQGSESYFPLFESRPGEQLINIIDGTASVQNITNMLNLDGQYISALVTAWNTWVDKYSDFSSALQTASDEGGLYLLMPTYITAHEQDLIQITDTVTSNAQTQQKKLTRQVSKKRVGNRLELKVGIPRPPPDGPSSFMRRGVDNYTSNFRPFSAAWKYQKHLWLPLRWYSNSPGGTNSGNPKPLSWYQANIGEAALIECNNQAQATGFVTDPGIANTFQLNLRAAEFDIKSPLAAETEWERDCSQFAVDNDGGILGFLAHAFGSAVGLPELGGVGNAIDGLLGM